MPNRIIRESICTSESIDNLTWFEEVFFYRLIVVCDDYGIFDARPKILNARLFPLKNTTDKQISDALQSLRTAGIVDLYEVDGKPFLQLRTWDKYQTVRAKKSKFPQKNESESICKQLQADDCKCSRNPIQSESISESISEYEKNTHYVRILSSNDDVMCLTADTGDEKNGGYPESDSAQAEKNAKEYDIRADIIKHLNEKAGTNYRSNTNKTKQLINARLKEGFSKDDFFTVIDKQCHAWKNTEYEKFLRPETLFGTKFEGYLNARGKGSGEISASDLDDLF